MARWTSGNQISTLIDGEEIFCRMRAGIETADARGFIYLAFWQFHPDLVLDVRTPHVTLGSVLRRKALQGVQIRLLIWDFLTRTLQGGIGSLTPRSVLATVDLEPVAEAQREARLAQAIDEEIRQRFDLASGPLVRSSYHADRQAAGETVS